MAFSSPSGSAVTISGTPTVNVGLFPGSVRTIDTVSAALASDVIMQNRTECATLCVYAAVAASSTNTQLVALTASMKICVKSFISHCGSTATDLSVNSRTGGGVNTEIHHVPAGANGGQTDAPNVWSWFKTDAGSALAVTTGTGATTYITLTYALET